MMLTINKVAIRVVRTQYHDNSYVYVPASALQALIASKTIVRFYRPIEQRWVDIVIDPVRGSGGLYNGPERRFFIDPII